MRSKKIILGTVQLGLNYGINNSLGKPSVESAFKILDAAYENGIQYLDTAEAYGNSEQIIGEFHRKYKKIFKICTKLIIADDEEEKIVNIIDNTIRRLQVEKIELMYLHRFEQAKNACIMQGITEAKVQKKIEKIGISIYEPSELEYILENLHDIVDIVQIPYNILDSARWNTLIEKSQNLEIEIYGRSVFLQGLLFKSEDDVQIIKMNAQKYIEYINHYAKKKNVTVAQLLVDFCKKSNLDGILIGCESVQQLKDNLVIWKNENCLCEEDLQIIREYCKNVPIGILDPRRW